MIPIRDHNPSRTNPIVTWTFLILNIAVFVYMFSLSSFNLEKFIARFALIPADIVTGTNLQTLVTAMFLHGGIGHIFGNMMFLRIFGDNLEDRLGHLKYLAFYLVCGFAASALQIVTDPNSLIPNLGASGAIAGLMGGYLVLFPKNRVDIIIPFGFFLQRATVPAQAMLIYWIAAQLLFGFGSLGVEGGGVAYWAHIGGFMAGILLIKLIPQRHTYL